MVACGSTSTKSLLNDTSHNQEDYNSRKEKAMKNDKMIKELSCLALAATVGFVSFADTFPNAGGDIASETEWGGPVPSTVTLNKTGTYTVGGDISLTTMVLAGGNVTFDLTDPSSGKVTVSGDGNRNGFYISNEGNNTTNYIRGGLWDFSKTCSFGLSRTSSSSGNAQFSQLTVSDGAVITNCYRVKVSFRQPPFTNELTLTGNDTTLHTIGEVNVSRYDGDITGTKAHLRILDGARFLYPGAEFYVDFCSAEVAPSRADTSVIVSGVGSLLSGKALYIGGRYRSGASVSICNEGALRMTGKMYIGYEAHSADTCVIVTSNGTANVSSIAVGHVATAHGNSLIVSDGGSCSVADYIYCGSAGNKTIISNAVVNCSTFRFTSGESNALHVCGSSGVLNCNSFYFGNGSGIATNAMVVLAGKSPSIVVNGGLEYDVVGGYPSSGTLCFKVPRGGYGGIPFRFTGTANFRANISYDVDLSECLSGTREAFTTTLIETGGTLTVNAAQFAAAQESVAAQLDAVNWRGSLEKVGNSLVLTARPTIGLMMIIK